MSESKITVRELLLEEREQELERVAWSAFGEQVMHRLSDALPADLEQATVEQLRRDVDEEVTAFAGRSVQFMEDVERRIFSEAKQVPFGQRLRQAWSEWTQSLVSPWTVAAGAAAALLITLSLMPGASAGPGQVSVDELTVEGGATVVASEGMTVVYLQDS